MVCLGSWRWGLLLAVVLCYVEQCRGEERGEAACWWTVQQKHKSICSNVEGFTEHPVDSAMPFFMGDILQRIVHSDDLFLQINDHRNSASYLSKCADRFSDNLSLKRNQLPAFYWPSHKSSSRVLPKATYYFAHFTNISLMESRFIVLDSTVKRMGHNATLLVDFNMKFPLHREIALRFLKAYEGELLNICAPSVMGHQVAIGIYKIGKGSKVPSSVFNLEASKIYIRNRKRKTRKRPKPRFPSMKRSKRQKYTDDDALDDDGDDDNNEKF